MRAIRRCLAAALLATIVAPVVRAEGAPLPVARVFGQVVDDLTGVPLAGIEVALFDDGDIGPNVIATATTDLSGNYSIDLAQASCIGVGFRDPSDVHVADSELVCVQSSRAELVSARLTTVGGFIEGTITDADTSLPIAGACVQASNGVVALAHLVCADLSGHFVTPRLEPGFYTVNFLSVLADGTRLSYLQDSLLNVVIANGTTTTVDRAQVPFVPTPPGTGSLQVTTVSAIDSTPVASCVEVDGMGMLLFLCGSGVVTFTNLPAGPFDVTATPFGSLFRPATALGVQVSTGQASVNLSHSRKGSVSGVLTDPNGDPAVGVPVTACVATPDTAFGCITGNGVLTGSDGSYTVGAGGTGDYYVHFGSDGTINAEWTEQWYPAAASFLDATPVAVVDGVDTPGKDAEVTRLPVLSGTVTGVGGVPLEGATVIANGLLGSFGGVRTDALGNYSITTAPPGTYTVAATAFGHAPGSVLDVALAAPGTPDVDLALTGESVITGTVTPSAAPLDPRATYCVTAVSETTFDSFFTCRRFGRPYRIGQLEAGTYTLQFSATGFHEEWWSNATALVDATPVTLGAVATFTADAELTRKPVLSGTVVDQVTGLPIPNASVTAEAPDGTPSGSFADAGADGTWAMYAEPGQWVLRAADGLFAGHYYAEYFDDAALLADATVLNVSGLGQSGLTIDLVPLPTITGTVTTAADASPLVSSFPGFTVCRFSMQVFDALDQVVSTAGPVCAADGSYSLSVPAGTYRVRFVAGPTLLSEFFSGVRTLAAATSVVVVDGAATPNVNAALEAAPLVSGVVTESATGSPVSGVSVVAVCDGTPVAGTSSLANGTWSVRVPLGACKFSFAVDSLDWKEVWWDGAAGADTATVVNTAPATDVSNINATLVPLGVTPAVPGAPTGVDAVPDNAQADVSWSAPASNGGALITGYTVTAAPGGATCTTTGALGCTVTGLTNGTAYTFTVKATNRIGSSAASDPSVAVTPRTVPGAPTGVVGTGGDLQVVVSWTAPASNGGSPITQYTVTSTVGGHSCTAIGTLTCTVTGLASGTGYQFTVTATNVAGTGPASTASPIATTNVVLSKPGAPTGVTGTAGVGKVTVSWAAPASNGGSPITGYAVTASPGGGTCTTSGATSCDVTGLTPGSGYTFTVVATNAQGDSPSSTASATVTVPTVPSAPAAPTGVPGKNQVVLSWAAPANGGNAITDYEVQYSPNNGSTWLPFVDGVKASTGATVTALANGAPYVFRVRAINDVGASAFGAASLVVVPRTTPSAPAAPVGKFGDRFVTLTWPVPGNGGNAISDYVVQYSSNNGSTWVTFVDGVKSTTGAKVTGLVNGRSYVFKVAAKNAAGQGAFSAKSAAVVPKTKPTAPKAPVPTALVKSVRLTWAAPANGGSAITDYLVQYSSNNGTTWVTFADGVRATTGATVTGLVTGRSYVFRVAARNVVGFSAYSPKSVAVKAK